MNRIFKFGKHKDNYGEKQLGLVPFGGFTIDNVFDDFFNDPFLSFSGSGLLKSFKTPAIDVYEEGNKFIVKVDLPGVDKKNIKVNLDRDILTISGETKKQKEENKKGYYYAERFFGTVQRSIRLPEGINAADLKASYKDGVLSIEVPKSEDHPQKGKDIEIE